MLLFTPISIGCTEVKNRIVLPSMCTHYCSEEGFITDRVREFIRKRAIGGIGLFIVPGNPYGKVSGARMAISEPKYFDGWRELAAIVREHGAKLVCQLHAAKPQAGRGAVTENPVDMSKDEINAIIQNYIQGAKNALEIGLDGVELHGAHAHEIARFLSPYYNKRQDEYGGNPAGRSKLAVDLVQGIKDACGDRLPVIVRLSGWEMVPGGREISETVECAARIAEAGADALHISRGMPESEQWISAPMDVEEGFNVAAAAAVKKAVDIPVITVNRILDPLMAEQILQEGKADMVAMARAHMAEPHLIKKFVEGQVPVRRCIGCNQGCRQSGLGKKNIYCMQNPQTGRESELIYLPATKEENIMIAGAGPAGLEAAVVLAERGYKPVVYEKETEVGGLIKLASLPPHKQSLEELIIYRKKMLAHLNIKVELGQEVTLETVRNVKPSVLILATGSDPLLPPIPGIEGSGVYSADEVYSGKVDVGSRVAVIGGGLIGCETAEYLASEGKNVVVFELADNIAKDLGKSRRYFMLQRMEKYGVDVRLLTKVTRIELPAISISTQGFSQVLKGFDSVVVAAGRIPAGGLAEQVQQAGLENTRVFVIGDASKPGLAMDAIYQGARTAADI